MIYTVDARNLVDFYLGRVSRTMQVEDGEEPEVAREIVEQMELLYDFITRSSQNNRSYAAMLGVFVRIVMAAGTSDDAQEIIGRLSTVPIIACFLADFAESGGLQAREG